MIEGSLEVKLRTIWTDESRDGKNQIREEKRRSKKIREEKVRRKKMQAREKVAHSRSTVFFHVFPMVGGSGGSKSDKTARPKLCERQKLRIRD